MATLGSLAINLTARTAGLTKGLGKAKKSIGGFGKSLRGAVGALAPLGMPLAAGAGIAAIVREGAGFQKQMSAIQAVNGATESQMASLRAEAERLGRSTAFSGREAAEGMEALARAGFTVEETLTATSAALNLAAADGLELKEAAGITASTIRQFGLDASNAGAVTDVLAKGAASGLVNVSQLGNAMGFAASAARLAGKGVFETTSALSVLSTQIGADKSGRALRSIFASMAKPTSEAQAQLDALGLSFIDSSGNIKPLATTGDEFGAALAGMPAGEQMRILNTVFDKQTASAFGGLMAAGGEELRRVEGDLQGAGGFAADAAETQLDNVTGAFTKVKSAMSGLAIDVFQTIKGPLQSGLESLAGWIGGPLTEGFSIMAQGAVGAFQWLGETIGSVSGWIKDMVTTGFVYFDNFGLVWDQVVDSMKLAFIDFINFVPKYFGKTINAITSMLPESMQTKLDRRIVDTGFLDNRMAKRATELRTKVDDAIAARKAMEALESKPEPEAPKGFDQDTLAALGGGVPGGAATDIETPTATSETKTPLTAALAGSKEAYSILNRAMKGEEKELRDVQKNTKATVGELKDLNENFGDLLDKFEPEFATIGA